MANRRVVLVTGVSRDLGARFARTLAARAGDPPAGDPRLPGAVVRLCQAARLTTDDRYRERLEARIARLLPRVDPAVLGASDMHTTCPWKGEASYYSLTVDGLTNPDAAWFYPEPKAAAEQIRGRVAFWRGVTVKD